MESTDAVLSALPDLSTAALTEISAMSATVGMAVQRVLTGPLAPSAQVRHAFQSSL